ncbi:hypothetical protein VAPA_2c03230 [Variovorax paradoxus B4]|uniref:Uncharacterized protein n=1 Tax=Variovorax paradoxus B4 TaxID=1246301 RepID=T1XKP6_VARPD|nr:hypothetical protein [Variovorax paradoxus]AGU52884.1 hypothetical protein VAPA_2c03230 [Variovorax paradoxus B4]
MPELKPRKPGTNANGNTLGSVVGETPSTAGKAKQANPEVKPETPKEESWWNSWGSSVVHTVFDVGGAIQGLRRGGSDVQEIRLRQID